LNKKIEEPKLEPIQKELKEVKKEIENKLPLLLQEKIESIASEELEIKSEVKVKTKRKAKKIDDKFLNNLKEYLSAKDIELLSILSEKPKELIAKIRTDSSFGKQEYILYAKDKKKITSEDIAIAHQKAQSEKSLAIIMAPGEIDKKSQDHYKDWKNLVKFEKIKF
jgi:BMFP domain-containing protein YqiC